MDWSIASDAERCVWFASASIVRDGGQRRKADGPVEGAIRNVSVAGNEQKVKRKDKAFAGDLVFHASVNLARNTHTFDMPWPGLCCDLLWLILFFRNLEATFVTFSHFPSAFVLKTSLYFNLTKHFHFR